MVFAISNHGLRHSGGIERYALTLVRGLHERGLRPLVVAKAFDPGLPEYAWCEARRVAMTGVPAKLRDVYFDWRLRRMKARGELHHPLLACNQTGAADLAVCGSTHPGYLHAGEQAARWSDGLKIRLEHAHLTNARYVVAHSQRMADEAVHFHGIEPPKIRLLYPPVDTTRFAPVDAAERARLRAELGLPGERAVFLLASTGHKRKGLELLLRYFTKTALPVTLAVAGRPIGDAGPNVRYLGYRSDIEAVYRAVDCTVMASSYEPFGLVGVESVLCGTPVLLADNVGCAEVIAAPAATTFALAQPTSFGHAVEQAFERWRGGAGRLAEPRRQLRYDPSVATHLDALLALAAQCEA